MLLKCKSVEAFRRSVFVPRPRRVLVAVRDPEKSLDVDHVARVPRGEVTPQAPCDPESRLVGRDVRPRIVCKTGTESLRRPLHEVRFEDQVLARKGQEEVERDDRPLGEAGLALRHLVQYRDEVREACREGISSIEKTVESRRKAGGAVGMHQRIAKRHPLVEGKKVQLRLLVNADGAARDALEVAPSEELGELAWAERFAKRKMRLPLVIALPREVARVGEAPWENLPEAPFGSQEAGVWNRHRSFYVRERRKPRSRPRLPGLAASNEPCTRSRGQDRRAKEDAAERLLEIDVPVCGVVCGGGTSLAHGRSMKASKLLTKDHRTVKGLFRKFERAKASTERRRLAEEIIEELSVHATIEEELVYPALRQGNPRLDDSVLEALEEHHVAKLTLAELDKMDVDDERFSAKMKVLRESIEMHIAEEEEKLLPRLDQLLSDDQDEALAQALIEAKESAPDHPHPMAPDTPPGNIVSAMLAKVLDFGKDMARGVTSRAKAAGHRHVTSRVAKAVRAAKPKSADKPASRPSAS